MSLETQSKFKELVPWGLVFPEETPAGMEFPGYPLHPAMIYESILNLVGFILLWFVFRKKEALFIKLFTDESISIILS